MGQPGRELADVMDEFIAGLGMPRRLRDAGIERAQLPQLAENCMLDDWTWSNPKPIRSAEQVMEILEMAY
jgi:maleylacetate reductase